MFHCQHNKLCSSSTPHSPHCPAFTATGSAVQLIERGREGERKGGRERGRGGVGGRRKDKTMEIEREERRQRGRGGGRERDREKKKKKRERER